MSDSLAALDSSHSLQYCKTRLAQSLSSFSLRLNFSLRLLHPSFTSTTDFMEYFWQRDTIFLELDCITVSKGTDRQTHCSVKSATTPSITLCDRPDLSIIHQQSWRLWQLGWPWWPTPPTRRWGRGLLWRQMATLSWALPAFPAAISCLPMSSMSVSASVTCEKPVHGDKCLFH